MRILMVSPGRLPVPAVRGGAVETLIESLLEYNEKEKKCKIDMIAMYDRNAERESSAYKETNFIFVNLGKCYEVISDRHWLPYKLLDVFFSMKALKIIRKRKNDYDCIVIQNEAVNGWIFQKYMEGKYIFHAHNDSFLASRQKERKFLLSCDKIVSISDYISSQFLKSGRKGRVVTVHNGVDVYFFYKKRYENHRHQIRSKMHIREQEIVLRYAGRLIPEKGVEELIKGFLSVPDAVPVKLMIVGSSFFENSSTTKFVRNLKELCQKKKNRFIFSGFIGHDQMPLYYSAADIGCTPSIWEEPFGLSVAEQMSMELPVIVTDSGAITEIVDESCGIILERNKNLSRNIADAIISLAKDKAGRQAMGKAGRDRICRYFNKKMFCEQWFKAIGTED